MVTKKVVDSWKTKTWYTVIAPSFMNNVEVGQVIGAGEEQLLNRVLVIPLKEITKDISHIYTNIRLRITEVKEKKAFTKFIGHEVSKEFIHTLVRRRGNVLHVVFDARSKDGLDFKVKAIILTGFSCSEKQKKALRNALVRELRQKVSAEELGQFIEEVLFGKVSRELYEKLKKIAPLRRIEVRKTELKEEFDVEKTGEKGETEKEAEASE
jgi:small subunit ribosomal protein S3Ae